jgi:L-lactate dehydrogenase complex protein LldG
VVGEDERTGADVTSARDDVLGRIRSANRTGRSAGAPAEVARTYRTAGTSTAGSAALLDLLQHRLLDYHAAVHRTTEAELAPAIAAALATAVPGGGRVVVPPGLPDRWLGAVADVVRDDGLLSAPELDDMAAVVTASAATCAETGTIVLDGSSDQGRRAITLVPDVHVCVVRADQVVETVPELLARLDPARALTLISGPSATSDIELNRVEGVHGPRHLHVVLVAAGSS